MSKWVVCKYPELAHGSSVKGLKVNSDSCLTCHVSTCPLQMKAIIDSFPVDAGDIPAEGLRLAKRGYCPLRRKTLTWCNASRVYCKYNATCPVAAKYERKTLTISIREIERMFIIRNKKQEGPMVMVKALDLAPGDIKAIESVFQVKYKLVAKLELVPKLADGSMPPPRSVKNFEKLRLVSPEGENAAYTDILNGNAKELFIVEKELVPTVQLVKVELAGAPARRAAPAANGRKR